MLELLVETPIPRDIVMRANSTHTRKIAGDRAAAAIIMGCGVGAAILTCGILIWFAFKVVQQLL
jgi:hypothetical protein